MKSEKTLKKRAYLTNIREIDQEVTKIEAT